MIISTEFENTHYGVQEAAGSNPVTRTNSKGICMAPLFACRFEPAASHFNPPPAGGRIASAGRWFKSSHSDHVGTDFTLFRRLFLPAAKKTPSTLLHLSLLSKPSPLRWASVLFFAVRSHAFGRLSVRSGRKLREIEKNIDFQVFDQTSSAVKEPFLLFCGFCLTLGFFSGQPVHPAGAFSFRPCRSPASRTRMYPVFSLTGG